MAISSILRHTLGPKMLIEISKQCEGWLLQSPLHLPCPSINPEILADVLVWIRRFSRLIPSSACLESACALQLWLALHGHASRICLGKRLEGSRLRMHAWLESSPHAYFYDPRFELLVECRAG